MSNTVSLDAPHAEWMEGGRHLPNLATLRKVAEATGQRIHLEIA